MSTYVDSVVAVGSSRKFVAGIVIPDFDALINYMNDEGLDYDVSRLAYQDGVCVQVGQDLIDNPIVRDLIGEEIKAANERLESYEKIKRYHVSSRKLTESTGELTPTFKVKRNVVLEHFADEVERLYR